MPTHRTRYAPWVWIASVLGAAFLLPLFAFGQSNPTAPADTAQTQTATAQEKPVLYWHGITLNGFASAAYTYNTNQPRPEFNQFRTFDFEDNAFKLDIAEVVVQRAVSKPHDAGFRVDVTGGESVPEVTASYGMFRDKCSGKARHIDIHQLFASYVVPVGKGLRVDAGKFVTHFGYEVIEGYDGYNDNYSRSFLFGYGIPFTHTGIKASYPLTSKVGFTAMVVNGWDDVHDNNRAKSIGAQLAITPTKSTTTYVNYMGGAESAANNHSLRQAFNVVQTWSATPKLSVAGDFLFAHEDDILGPEKSAIWAAFAGYARYSVSSQFSMSFRGEVFRDADSVRTGKTQTLTEFTITPEYRRTVNLGRLPTRFVFRGDFRCDHSSVPVFVTETQLRQYQVTLAVNLIYAF
jgi:hypothetical protein